MKIQEIYVQSFGTLRERFFRLEEGVNILEGPNESGKSTLAAFIKYIFYGPGSKNSPDRMRYLTGAKSGGWLLFEAADGNVWRVERVTMIDSDGVRESMRDNVRIVDTRTNKVIPEKNPGEYFFGVNESVFVNTAYIGQVNAVRPDGTSLSGAVENMLQSADENVDLKKAGDRLNQARRDLLPKNSAGGKIREKEEEKARLEEALAAAADQSAKVLDAQAALETAARKRQELEEKKEQAEEALDAAETVNLCKKLAAAEETAGKLKSYQSALDVLSAPPFSDLQDKLNAIRNAGTQDAEMSGTGSRLKMRNEDASAALEDGEYLESKSRLFLAVAITMAIAGLVALAAGAVMVYFGFPSNQFIVPFCAMGLFVIIGVVFYIMQGKNLSLLQDILDEWNVDSLDELDEIAEEGDEGRKMSAGQNGAVNENAAAQIQALAAACGVAAGANPEETLEALQKKADKVAADRETVRAKVENLSGRLDVLKEAISGLDRAELIAKYKKITATPAGKAAMQMDAAAMARLQKERDFAVSAWNAQARKEAELEHVLASCSQDGASPDILAGQLARVEEEIAEMSRQHDAYALAQEALQSAGQSLRTTLIPTITAKASETMRAATGGKYDHIAMDPSFGLQFESRNGSNSVDLLSKGTADLAYISLRLALAQTLFGENGKEVPPMIMDETFAAVDCDRLAMALEAMCSSGVQCILYTCRSDEGKIGEQLGCTVMSIA